MSKTLYNTAANAKPDLAVASPSVVRQRFGSEKDSKMIHLPNHCGVEMREVAG